MRRLTAYQDVAYARHYLDRLAPIAAADARAGAGGRFTREVARHLALRMSYEDVIRVAQAKIAPERIARIVARTGAKPGEPVGIVEFLKPGVAELCSLLPPSLASGIIALADRRGWLPRFHWGMEIKTHTVAGYLRLLALAKLRRFRRRTYRYAQEQAAIDSWLALIVAAAEKSIPLALEIAACAGLVKGYGDTLTTRRRQLRRDRSRMSFARSSPMRCRLPKASMPLPAPARRRSPTPRAKRSPAAWPKSRSSVKRRLRRSSH